VPDADLRAPGAVEPERLVRQIREHRPNRTAASPALLDRLARHAASRGLTFDSFEHIHTGGAPVFPRTLDAVQAMAPRAEVVAVYGSTEAEPIAHIARHAIDPGDRERMLNGAGLLTGRPVPSIDLRILPDRWGTPIGPYKTGDLEALVLPVSRPGEIVVAGAHVLGGYLDGVGDEETKFRVDGRIWHRTGDAGYLDDDGRLWLLGRCAARISDGDGTLYPFAVESAATTWAWVVRAALVSRGRRRVLAVELDRSAPADALEVIGRGLAWARLARVTPVNRIPVDARHNAKVDYPRLERLLRDGTGGTSRAEPQR
jgi:acyl-CoA synthetase (AMP-forming)/AMP-acid ligase II